MENNYSGYVLMHHLPIIQRTTGIEVIPWLILGSSFYTNFGNLLGVWLYHYFAKCVYIIAHLYIIYIALSPASSTGKCILHCTHQILYLHLIHHNHQSPLTTRLLLLPLDLLDLILNLVVQFLLLKYAKVVTIVIQIVFFIVRRSWTVVDLSDDVTRGEA